MGTVPVCGLSVEPDRGEMPLFFFSVSLSFCFPITYICVVTSRCDYRRADSPLHSLADVQDGGLGSVCCSDTASSEMWSHVTKIGFLWLIGFFFFHTEAPLPLAASVTLCLSPHLRPAQSTPSAAEGMNELRAGWRWRRSGVALVGIQYHTARTSAVRLLYEWTADAIGWARVTTASQSRCLDPFVAAAAVSPGYHLLKLHRRACGWISGSGWHVFAQPRLSHNPKQWGVCPRAGDLKK